MRTIIFISSLIGPAILLPAQQPTAVSPQTLSSWTILSAEAVVFGKQSELTLPAGAQIARSFAPGDVGLQFTTQPFVGADEADWPVLELGSAALVFGRSGPTGKLLLVVGNGAPIELPFDFKLDAAGRSVEPLAINFSRQDLVIKVEVGGQTQEFSFSASEGQSTEIVASAGAVHDWTFERLNVTVAPVTVVNSIFSNVGSAANSSVNKGSSVTSPPSAGVLSVSSGVDLGATPKPAAVKAATVQVAAAVPQFALEIFTPPAIRRPRVEAIRRVTATANK